MATEKILEMRKALLAARIAYITRPEGSDGDAILQDQRDSSMCLFLADQEFRDHFGVPDDPDAPQLTTDAWLARSTGTPEVPVIPQMTSAQMFNDFKQRRIARACSRAANNITSDTYA